MHTLVPATMGPYRVIQFFGGWVVVEDRETVDGTVVERMAYMPELGEDSHEYAVVVADALNRLVQRRLRKAAVRHNN